MAGVECDRVPPPRASPVESAASTEREALSFPLPSVPYPPSIHSTSSSIFPSLALPLASTPSPTPAACRCRLPLRGVARRGGCGGNGGGGGGVDRNQYKTGLHVFLPSRSRPTSLPYVCLAAYTRPSRTLPPTWATFPRPSNRGDPVVVSLFRSVLSRPPSYRPPHPTLPHHAPSRVDQHTYTGTAHVRTNT